MACSQVCCKRLGLLGLALWFGSGPRPWVTVRQRNVGMNVFAHWYRKVISEII